MPESSSSPVKSPDLNPEAVRVLAAAGLLAQLPFSIGAALGALDNGASHPVTNEALARQALKAIGALWIDATNR